MGFKCGIVGLPNVGKSTLFNALTRTAAAQAANYPFCTIEPNTGEVAVPDQRLRQDRLDRQIEGDHSDHVSPSSTSPAWCAARRRAKAWATSSSPISARSMPSCMCCAASRMTTSPMSRAASIRSRDAETVETELMLADLESLERRIVRHPQARPVQGQGGNDRAAGHGAALALLRRASRRALAEGLPDEDNHLCRASTCSRRIRFSTSAMSPRLTPRPATRIPRPWRRWRTRRAPSTVIISAAIEAEVAQLPDEEEQEFLATIGLEEARPRSADPRRLRSAASHHLFHRRAEGNAGLDDRAQAPRHRRPPASSTPISSAASFAPRRSLMTTIVALGGEVPAKEAGKARDEGKEYVVQDGDVMLFKFNT